MSKSLFDIRPQLPNVDAVHGTEPSLREIVRAYYASQYSGQELTNLVAAYLTAVSAQSAAAKPVDRLAQFKGLPGVTTARY